MTFVWKLLSYLHAKYWEMKLLLLQDSNCGAVAKQMYDNLTSPSDNSVGR